LLGCESLGNPRFIGVEDLERSRFLKDDCFVVQCTATIVEEMSYVKEGSCRRKT
jgi:hypothetical protein